MPSQLHIDTSGAPIAGPSSASRLQQTLSPSSIQARGRLRTTSNASTMSIVSPMPSSASSSSLSVAGATREEESPVRLSSSPKTSLDLDETLGPMSDYVLAMHDYTPTQQNATCLSFRAGQVIHVLNRDNSGWWDGELEGRRGWFPSNYVNIHPEEEEDVTQIPVRSKAHRTRRPSMPESDGDSYCPPIMVPLLHGLSLLQNAVRTNRVHHFQPSTACIISCVRSILSATDTLLRDAPILQQFPPLAHERRGILAVLANLVAQAKRASEGYVEDDESHELEVDAMLRLGGQVFSHMRRFLAVAVQCGVELPERRQSSASLSGSADIEDPAWAAGGDLYDPDIKRTESRQSNIREAPVSPTLSLRAKSMGDLRSRARFNPTDCPVSMMPSRSLGTTGREENIPAVPAVPERTLRRHRPIPSVSSSASSSSYSSLESSAVPRPPFPSGPCSTMQVTEALRSTHDHYLSTIAAFIGHAHSYSRASHASSTGHMYDLVREIVEMVCKLLTIVEAVLTHPDVPNNRIANLKNAKEGLYQVTSTLAESVRLLTVPLPYSVSEEDEKQGLLRSATGALKAGSDCVGAVKICLSRSLGERPFVLQVPNIGTPVSQMFGQARTGGHQLTRSVSSVALHRRSEEDLTLQPHEHTIRVDESSGSESCSAISKSSSAGSRGTGLTSPDEPKSLSPLMIDQQTVDADLPSPSASSFGPELSDKELPGLPHEPLEPIPESNPMGWLFAHDYPLDDVAYNSDGHLVGATIDVLVEKLTPHDSIVDPAFSAVFFLTFRLFSTPVDLTEALIKRWNLAAPVDMSDDDLPVWHQRKVFPIRLRVSNFVKTWVEMYWRSEVDDPAADRLKDFVEQDLRAVFSAPAQRIAELFKIRSESKDYTISPRGDRSRDPGMSINPPTIVASEIPRPTMTKTLLAALRGKNFSSIGITDFDPLELARQLTIMECNLYCAIQPEEILESGQEGARPPVNVRAVSSLSTVITGWVMESILNEPDIKKRAGLIKFFIKVADRCTSLHNYSTPRSMLAALDSSTISRLHQTWLGLPQKNRLQLEAMRRLADHGRNYHEYRSKLRNTAPPAVPFLGLYLTDVTFCREGNPSHRVSPQNPNKKLLNFNKYHKLARIVQDMQRFQVPYNLKAIPEVQIYLNYIFQNSQHHGDLQDLYRRSLLVEPKQPADAPPAGDMRHIFTWATRSQLPSKVATPPPIITS
ncbi:ras GEF [Hymenopellis radicata]|nr:ras GEF [Hymenopellis radicata]